MSLLGPQLEAFLAVVQSKTVLGAAKSIGITQTGVTQRIRTLEDQLSTTLFTRSRQGMRLTQEGEALLRYCQSAQDLAGETLSQISGAGKASEVRSSILGPTSIMRTRVIPQSLPVMSQFPELLLSFEISDEKPGSEALRTGAVQFAILPDEEVRCEMDSKRLKPEEYVLVGKRNWKGRKVQELVTKERIIDFDSSDTMTHAYLKKAKLLHCARPERHFVNNNESLLQLFEAGIGYGVLTREFAEQYTRQYDIAILNPDFHLENRLALAWYPRPNASGYFKAIIGAIH